MKRSRLAYLILGGILVGGLLFIAIFADRLTNVSPYFMDSKSNIVTDGSPPFKPDQVHILGTDEWGRDIWSRLAYGARWSLAYAFLIMAARLLFALPMAVASAFGPRVVGWVTGRLYVYTSAIPPLLIYLFILSSPSLREIGIWPSAIITIILLTLVEWPRLAVAIKGRLEELASEGFVEGAVAAGATRWRIFWTHLMPHLWPTLLNLIVAEMGRGLLVLAQLGIFGIFVGGGIWELLMGPRGENIWVRATGVPEWGTMLATTRRHIYGAPWIPLPAAFAFFAGVVGFNLLSQGLEGVVFSLSRVREATTGRLSARWRWALAAVPFVAVLWYYQGLPWTREAGIDEMVARQAAALTGRSVEGYLETLDSGSPQYRNEQKIWAEKLMQGDHQVAVVRYRGMKISGHEATALWTISLGYRDQPPVSVTRSARLVRRWGTWYDAGESFITLRGVNVDMQAFYDPTDPTRAASQERFQVQFLLAAADYGYSQVEKLFPGVRGGRPVVKLYPSHAAFEAAVLGEAKTGEGQTIAYTPGQAIRVSPDFMKGLDRRAAERKLAYEFVKHLAAKQEARAAALPILMGTFERGATAGTYRIDLDQFAGLPLFPLPELLKKGSTDVMKLGEQRLYAAESALLVEFLATKLSREQMLQAAADTRGSLAGLAAAMGRSPEQLARDFNDYVQGRIADTSVLKLPAGRERVPLALTDAVAERAIAAGAGRAEEFLARADAPVREQQAQWLNEALQAGMKGLDAYLLEMESSKSGGAKVYLLQRITYADGRASLGIVIQQWVERGGKWLLSK